jgi:hypothetical protein
MNHHTTASPRRRSRESSPFFPNVILTYAIMVRTLASRAAVVAALLALASVAPAQAPAANVTGTWTFEVVTENGTGTPTVVLKQDGDTVTGTYESARSGLRKIEGKVRGDKLTFTAKSPQPDGVDLLFSGTIVGGDFIAGTADFSGQGTATFSAKRIRS